MATQHDDRTSVTFLLGDGITTVSRHFAGAQPDEQILLGDREQLGRVLVKALAEITEDPLLRELADATEFGAFDVAIALRTLGYAAGIGVQLDPHDDLGQVERGVAEQLAAVMCTVDTGECGWCGEEGHATKDCTSDQRAEFDFTAGK